MLNMLWMLILAIVCGLFILIAAVFIWTTFIAQYDPATGKEKIKPFWICLFKFTKNYWYIIAALLYCIAIFPNSANVKEYIYAGALYALFSLWIFIRSKWLKKINLLQAQALLAQESSLKLNQAHRGLSLQ